MPVAERRKQATCSIVQRAGAAFEYPPLRAVTQGTLPTRKTAVGYFSHPDENDFPR